MFLLFNKYGFLTMSFVKVLSPIRQTLQLPFSGWVSWTRKSNGVYKSKSHEGSWETESEVTG